MAARLAMAMMLLAAMMACGKAVAAPQARALNGVLDLRGQNLDKRPPTELAGEWSFAWDRFIDPHQASSADAAPPLTLRFPAPGPASRPEARHRAPTATPAIRCRCCATRASACPCLVPTERTAHRLYVNGRLVAQQGAPGPSAPTAWGAVRRGPRSRPHLPARSISSCTCPATSIAPAVLSAAWWQRQSGRSSPCANSAFRWTPACWVRSWCWA